MMGVEDKNKLFHARLIIANGTEDYESQSFGIRGSDDFSKITQLSGNYKSIVAIIFYKNVFVMPQWFRNGNPDTY